MKKKIAFEFDSSDRISLEYKGDGSEKFDIVIQDGAVGIYANRQAYSALSKLMAKLALCDAKKDFHIHLNQNFDDEARQIAWLGLTEEEE